MTDEEITYICMPLKATCVPIPKNHWESAICPMCGAECWMISPMAQKLLDVSPNCKAICTECALKNLSTTK